MSANVATAYNKRCALCLNNPVTCKIFYILDSDLRGEVAKDYHLIEDTFIQSSSANRFILCASCHSYMTPSRGVLPPLMLVPCAETCEYLHYQLEDHPEETVDSIMQVLANKRRPNDDEKKARFFSDLFEIISTSSLLHASPPVTPSYPDLVVYDADSNCFSTCKTKKKKTYRIFDTTRATKTRLGQLNVGSHNDGSKHYFRLPGASVGAFLGLPIHLYGGVKRSENTTLELRALLKFILDMYGEDAAGEEDAQGKRKKKSKEMMPRKSARLAGGGGGGKGSKGGRGGRGGGGNGSSAEKGQQRLAPMPQQEPMALEQSEKQTLFDASTTSNDHILMGSGMLHPTPWNQAKDSTMLVQSRPIMPYQGEDSECC